MTVIEKGAICLCVSLAPNAVVVTMSIPPVGIPPKNPPAPDHALVALSDSVMVTVASESV